MFYCFNGYGVPPEILEDGNYRRYLTGGMNFVRRQKSVGALLDGILARVFPVSVGRPKPTVIYQLTQKTTPLGVVEWDIPCGILVCSMHGYTSFRPWGLQNAVPCRVDTEIPQANPESWACGLFAARARKDPAGDAGRGDRRDQCPAGSCPRGDGDSSEVRGFGRDRKAEGTVGLCPAQEVRLARQGVLERERRLVARIFRLDRRYRRKKNPCLRQIPARTGFRSSEACTGVVPRACPWGSIKEF